MICALVIVSLGLAVAGLLVWVLIEYRKVHEMYNHPVIWCHDWQCNTQCPASVVEGSHKKGNDTPKKTNPCFRTNHDKGLAECLYGPKATGATSCYNPRDPDWKDKCLCHNTGNNSCLSGCAETFDDLPADTTCCCVPGDGCPNHAVPPICKVSNIPS